MSLRQRRQQIVPVEQLHGHPNKLALVVGHPSETGQDGGVVQVEGQGPASLAIATLLLASCTGAFNLCTDFPEACVSMWACMVHWKRGHSFHCAHQQAGEEEMRLYRVS